MNDLNWTLNGLTGPPAFEPGFQTDWLAVRTAGQSTPEAVGALEKLCRTYWYFFSIFIHTTALFT
jgi:hypothetical protein